DENGDETKIDENKRFKFDYEDKLDSNTILTEIQHLIHHADKTISLLKQDIIETNILLKKSMKGESMDLNRENNLMITSDNNQKQPTRKCKQITSVKSARKLSFSLMMFILNFVFIAVRKRRRTQGIDEIIEGEKKVVK
ncbi:unnamed protein product, partial [Rotaria sp. Silwood2]